MILRPIVSSNVAQIWYCVGFTSMSAAIGSASKLVEILNDLFTTFDSLSEVANLCI